MEPMAAMVRTGPMDYLRIRYGSIWEIQAQNLNLSHRSGVLRAQLGQQELKVRQVLREPQALLVLKVQQVQMVRMESQVLLARKVQQERQEQLARKDQLVQLVLPVPMEKQWPMDLPTLVRVLEWMVIFTSIPQPIRYLVPKRVGPGLQEFPWLDRQGQRVLQELLAPLVQQGLKVQQEQTARMARQEQQVQPALRVLHLQEQELLR